MGQEREGRFNLSPDLLRLAIDASPVAMLIADAEGRIVLVNSESERLLGFSRRELLGQPVELLLPTALRAQHRAHRHDFMAGPRARRMGTERDLTARRRDGSELPVEVGLNPIHTERGVLVLIGLVDLTARKAADERQRELIAQLQAALGEIKSLRGLIPICAGCKKVRDDSGYWHSVESYLRTHTDADFSHGFCPECSRGLYGELWDEGEGTP